MIFKQRKYDLYYELHGNLASEESLVFMNGVFHGSASWIKQIRYKPFMTKYKMLFIDYPGFGGSAGSVRQPYTFDEMYNSILSLINELNLKQANLIGYSLGGIIALDMVFRSPDRFNKLVLLNCAHRVSIKCIKLMNNVESMLNQGVETKTIFANVYPWFFSDKYLNQLNDFESTILRRYADYNANRTEVSLFLNANKTRRMQADPRLRIPTALIGCAGDVVCPEAIQREFVSLYPNVKWHLLPGDSHVSNVEHYQTVNEFTHTFLRD